MQGGERPTEGLETRDASGSGIRISAILLAFSLLLASLAPAAETLTPVAPPAPKLTGVDSLRAIAARADTADTKSRADTTLVVMHHHNHRQQIITGSVIMACLAGVMVMMNNYNPRPVNQF